MPTASKTGIVTGGTRGIGLGIADALGREGFNVVLCGRRTASDVADVVDNLRSGGATVEYFRADVSDAEDRESLVSGAIDKFGRVDVLVNNAGVAPARRTDILEATAESFDRVLGINLRGPYFLTQLVARHMITEVEKDEQPGTIINITSISSTVASPMRGEYCISKAGLSMVSKLWAVRLAEYGINVFEIRPGLIKTDMTQGVEEKYRRLIEDGLTLQTRWGQPGDVGKCVAMLVRGDLPYSTGQVIMVDGGMLIDRL